jgi:hypothetical protein
MRAVLCSLCRLIFFIGPEPEPACNTADWFCSFWPSRIGGRIVIAAAVANKGKDYAEDDVRAFTSILNNMWEILRRQRAEQALKESLARTTEVQDDTI